MNKLKEYIPPILLRKLIGLFYGWQGNYTTWHAAKKRCVGYDDSLILEKVKEAVLKVKEGKAVFERDSVLFDKPEYSYPLLSTLLLIAQENNNQLNIIDFGGSLGSTYFQNRPLLKNIQSMQWNIVEQKHFVETGKLLFEDDILKFYNSIDASLSVSKSNVILLSSVLQYMEEPYALIKQIVRHRFDYIILDRTPFVLKGDDRITIQRVPKKIYNASYPCWFFNERKMLDAFDGYTVEYEFNALDKANIASVFKGFYLKRIPHA